MRSTGWWISTLRLPQSGAHREVQGKVDPGLPAKYCRARREGGDCFHPHGWGFTGAGSDWRVRCRVRGDSCAAGTGRPDRAGGNISPVSTATKAVERLQRIAELFPAEEERTNGCAPVRTRELVAQGRTPKSAPLRGAVSPPPAAALVPWRRPGADNARASQHSPGGGNASRSDGHRGNQPADVSSADAPGSALYHSAEIGKHLGVVRCLVAVGAAGEGAQAHRRVFHARIGCGGAARIATIAGLISTAAPDALGGIELTCFHNLRAARTGIGVGIRSVLTTRKRSRPRGRYWWATRIAEVESQTKFLPPGGGRSTGAFGKSHAAAFAGSLARGGG